MIKDIRYYNRKYDKIVNLTVSAGRHAFYSAVHLDITLHGRSSNNELTVDFDLTNEGDKTALKELISSLQGGLDLYEETMKNKSKRVLSTRETCASKEDFKKIMDKHIERTSEFVSLCDKFEVEISIESFENGVLEIGTTVEKQQDQEEQ